MNRTERLHAIHEAMRRAGSNGVSSAELAEHFEVSPRTIKRDVSALQQGGAPIWAQSGPGGGYHLDITASLPPIAFSPSQAVATIIALAVLPTGSPFTVDAKIAANKVLDTLGPPARARAEAMAERVWVRHLRQDEVTSPAVLRAVERSLADQVVLNIRYSSANGAVTNRTIEPNIVAWSDECWYLVGHCRLRQAIRWFRLDRVQEARCTRQRYEPMSVDAIGEPPEGAKPVGR